MKEEKNIKLNEEEREILDSFVEGKLVSKNEDLDKYKEAAKQTFAKSKRINFRISEKDFRSIQIKAREEGLPYQTMVSSVIHKFVSGRLKEQ